MRRHAVNCVALLLAACLTKVQGQGFLGQISQSVGQAVEQAKTKVEELPIKDAKPEMLAQAINAKQGKELVGAIKDTINRTVSEAVSGAKKVVEPMQDLRKQTANLTQVLNATATERRQISGALQTVGGLLTKGASAVANATASSVQDVAPTRVPPSLEGATMMPQAPAVVQVRGEDIAAALSSASPELAKVLNRTGAQIAKAIEAETPKVARSMNSKSGEVARMFGGTEAPPLGSELDGPHGADVKSEEGEGMSAFWLAVTAPVLGGLAMLGGMAVYQKYNWSRRRGGLLSDGSAIPDQEMGLSPGPLRVSAPSREPLFQQF